MIELDAKELEVLEELYGEYTDERAVRELLESLPIPDEERVFEPDYSLPMPKVWRSLVATAKDRGWLSVLLRRVLHDSRKLHLHSVLERYLPPVGVPEEEILVELLGGVFWRHSHVEQVLRDTNVDPASINWSRGTRGIWRDAIRSAREQGMLHFLVHTAMRRGSGGRDLKHALCSIAWTPGELERLALHLASRLYFPDSIREHLFAVGLSPGDVYWDQPTRAVWKEIVELARRRGRLHQLVADIHRQQPDVGKGCHLVQELLDIDRPSEPLEVPVRAARFYPASAFLEGLGRSLPAVCRVDLGEKPTATGFLVGNSHHVMTADYVAKDVRFGSLTVVFGYDEPNSDVRRHAVDVVAVGAGAALLKVAEPIEAVPVEADLDVPLPAAGDALRIIHHPRGMPKHISIDGAIVRALSEDLLTYVYVTDPGSGGAPVFDAEWRLVGLHYRRTPGELPDGAGTELQGGAIPVGKLAEVLSFLADEDDGRS